MAKTGLGNVANDKSVNVSTRGLLDVLSVEVVDSSGGQITDFTTGGFDISSYDYISLSYDNDNLVGVVFKTGGSGGTTVATLTLAYSGSNLISVTKT